ncbi:protein PIH1D3 [Lingula anatina]|uniref:Protein PIH1D3 n=1 Tax=Lingula anatina TaxID=7574 RepID=A0A1S3HJE2_LINAN|nr:protein PIH1D3 [Lingula anatina]|eukprot:XP_013386250.1 protein PIH1D3 [Lingula anatina]
MELYGESGITALANLLTPNTADSDSDEDTKPGGITKLGPGDIGPKQSTQPAESQLKTVKKEGKDIWEEEEVQEGAEYDDIHDTRPQPQYEIIYKQAVTSEDMFLGMGNKTPATSSCEDMVVKVMLPDTKYPDVNLNVTNKYLDCRTPRLRLGLHLPHPVDAKNGKAQWDGDKGVLTITLRMTRDYDDFNF